MNALLFVLTAASVYFVGLSQSVVYVLVARGGPRAHLSLTPAILQDPQVHSMTLVYVVVLMAILMAHELGHYLACRFYGLDSTLPYFIPFPFPFLNIIGTLGAFIKILSPIRRKKELFDIGVAGPLSGFVLALPAMAYGLSLSGLSMEATGEGVLRLSLGDPLLLKLLARFFFPSASSGNLPHPLAFAGWVGALVTSLNLFPIGQLDGGHVAYALFGSRSKMIARLALVAFVVLGVFFWVGWFVLALIILLVGTKHPPVWDEEEPLSPVRKILAVVVVLIFILCFVPDPVKGFSLLDFIR